MTRYLLDSTVIIRYARGHLLEMEWLRRVLNTAEVAGTCPVVVAECFSGTAPQARPGMFELFDSLTMWSIEREDGAVAGVYRYDFARRGMQLTTPDTLIAAVARRVGATVVTDNVKDFPMDDIQVISIPRAAQ